MPTIDNPVEHFSNMTAETLQEATLRDGQVSIDAVDASRDAHAGINDLLKVAGDLQSTLATLDEQKPLMVRNLYDQKRAEAIDAANRLSLEAQQRVQRAATQAEDAVLTGALPKLASDSREALARQELDLALGDVRGSAVSGRVLGIAKSGSAEVQGVLATPYARTALIARGVSDVDRVLRDAKVAVAHSGTTPEALKAADGLARLGKLTQASAMAAAAVRHALPQSRL